MHYVYILQSSSSGKYYVGNTSDLGRRLAEHNRGRSLSTRGTGPWMMIYNETFEHKAAAIRREIQIKRWRSRKLIEELVNSALGTRPD